MSEPISKSTENIGSSALRRELSVLADGQFDLLVIGGGITGAGIAHAAAASGIKVLVVDANDFGSGTSSRSTKLIHGGLRYLAMGDFALVREAALERKTLHMMAPHLADPRWMVLPAKSWLEWLKFQIGVMVYEWLGAVETNDRYRGGNKAESIAALEPLLNWGAFPHACIYREYLTDDARLVLATLRSAVRSGASSANYVRVTKVDPTAAGYQATLQEADGNELVVHANCVVNAAGPWAESLLPKREGPSRLRLSKGVHIVLPHERLPVNNLVMIGTEDSRLLFVIPRGRHTYVGTTDTPHEGGPETWPEVTSDDVNYLLRPLATYFPDHPVDQSDVVASWAGLRPLVNEPGKAPKEMSRKDEVWVDGGFITIAGGKLTGFRKMAESVLRQVRDYLGLPNMIVATQALVGGDIKDLQALVAEVAERHTLNLVVAERLVRLYGSEALTLLGDAPTRISSSLFSEEVVWAITVEGAQTLEDIVYRRMRIAWFVPSETTAALETIANLAATHLQWDKARVESELAACRARLALDLEFV